MPKTSIQLNINTVGELNFKGLTRRMAAFSKEAEDGCAQMKILHTRYKALVEAQKEFDSNAGGNNDSEMGDDYEELQEKLADCRKELRELQTELLAATVTPPFSKAHTVQPLYGRGGETMTDMLSNSSGAASLMALFSTSTSAIGIAAAAAAAVTGFQGSTEERDAKFAMVVTKEFARVTGNSNQDLAQSVGAGIAEAMAGDEDIDMGSVVERYLSLTSEMGQKTRQWDKGIGLEYMEGRIPGLESEKAFDKSHGDQLAAAKGALAELMGELESERNRTKQEAYKVLLNENVDYPQILKTANNPATPDKERWSASQLLIFDNIRLNSSEKQETR